MKALDALREIRGIALSGLKPDTLTESEWLRMRIRSIALRAARALEEATPPSLRAISPPRLVCDWKGCYVRSRAEMRNRLLVFPKGTVFKVQGAGGTKTLEALPCECCGVMQLITVGGTRAYFERAFDFVEFQEEVQE